MSSGRPGEVRYVGSYSVVEGVPVAMPSEGDLGAELESGPEAGPESQSGPGASACGVCREEPAPWQHSAETPPGAGLAAAADWNLCGVCHRLVADVRTAELAGRWALEDLDDDQRLELAGRLR